MFVTSNDTTHTIDIQPKTTGYGSGANGGELLFLALATCYCNDIYREAAARGVEVIAVDVEVEGEFGAPGEPARNVTYRAKIAGKAGAVGLDATRLERRELTLKGISQPVTVVVLRRA